MAFAIRTIYIFRELRLAIGCHGISCNIDLKRNQAEIEQNYSTSPPPCSPSGSPPGSPPGSPLGSPPGVPPGSPPGSPHPRLQS